MPNLVSKIALNSSIDLFRVVAPLLDEWNLDLVRVGLGHGTHLLWHLDTLLGGNYVVQAQAWWIVYKSSEAPCGTLQLVY